MTEITRSAVWFRTGPPWRLLGLTVRGYAIRYGVPLPPAAGLARAAALEAAGLRSLAAARRGYGQVLREILVAAGSTVPPPVELHLAQPRWPAAADALVESRRVGWRQTGRRVAVHSGSALAALEQCGRAALKAAVGAFNYLEDAELAVEAHMQAHAIGELVAGVFGCHAQREDGCWFDVCPLSLMHLRVGSSPGFVARRHCSVCDGDLADPDCCEHLPGVAYPVVAACDQDGNCTICGAVECAAHPVGSSHLVAAHAVIHEVDRLDEISAVPRPRDPLARYDAVEIPAQEVAGLPGSNDPNAVLECKRCVRPCIGFTSAEEALGLA
jgi:hypothetical protein